MEIPFRRLDQGSLTLLYLRKAPIFPDCDNFHLINLLTVTKTFFQTFSATPKDIEKKWVLIDAEGVPLGRLASRIATILRGKNKPMFTPHMDTGDNVVVINAEKVVLTGKKMTNKLYFSYSGYPGGEKFVTPATMLVKNPTFLITHAVKGMLPKNRLSRRLMTNLRVYAGPVHRQVAQKPEPISL